MIFIRLLIIYKRGGFILKKLWKIALVFILLGLLAACGHKAGNTAENKNANRNATVSNNKNVSTEEKENKDKNSSNKKDLEETKEEKENSPEADEETQEDASAVDLENNFIDYKDGTFTGENVVGFEKSEDGKKLKDFQIRLEKDVFDYKSTVKNYQYENGGKIYKGDLKLIRTSAANDTAGNAKAPYCGLYQGDLEAE